MICSDLVCLLNITSSANSLMLELVTDNDMSFMKAWNSTGLSTSPCGTPQDTGGLLASWFTTALCTLLVRKEWFHLLVVPVMPCRTIVC